MYAQVQHGMKISHAYQPLQDQKRFIDSLNDIADTLCLHKNPQGEILARQALSMSRKLNYYTGIGDASQSLGLTKFRRDNDSAVFYFKQAMSAHKMGNAGFERMAYTLNNVSRTYDELQAFDSSLIYAQAAQAYIQQNPAATDLKRKWFMFTYGATANAFSGLGYYDSANHYYLKAVRLAEESLNVKMLAVYFKGLSGIQSKLENDAKAIEYGLQAIHYSRDDCRGLSIAMASVAALYSKAKKYDQADMMADSSIKVGRACNVWNSIGRNYITLGNSQLQRKNYAAALGLYKIGLSLAQKHSNSKASIGNLHRRLGELYQIMDSVPQAKENYNAALVYAEGDMEMQAAISLALSGLLYREGNADAAYQYARQYNQFRDMVFTQDKVKAITELNTRYETEKKNQQLLLLSKEKILQAALMNEQQQQLAKERLIKREQELEIANYELQTEKAEQLLKIQALDLENNRIRQSEQQAMLDNAAVKLRNEINQKALAVDEAKQKRNWIIFLLSSFAFAAIIAVLLFNRYRMIKEMQNRESLVKQRERISRELHDEIGATLSGIAMYSHLAKEQISVAGKEQVGESLNIIQKNAGEMVNKLNDIVWLIHPGNDNLQQLLQRLEDYAVQMASVKGIRVKSNINSHHSKSVLSAESRRNIYLLYKEAINNAVKYSNATQFNFDIIEDDTGITLTFSDNGEGFDKERIKKGNGLDNMENRAKEIVAEYSYDSLPGGGTRVVLHLPQ